MRWRIAISIIFAALTSCTVTQQPYSTVAETEETPIDHSVHIQGQPGDVRQKDRDFVYWATIQCMYDVELANQAAARASSPAVRDFAQRILTECRIQDRRLGLLNEAHIGITLPSTLDQKHATQLDQIRALTGPAFDRAYVQDQLTESEETLKLFQDQSNSGSEPVLQRFATTAIPDLEQRQSDTKRLKVQVVD